MILSNDIKERIIELYQPLGIDHDENNIKKVYIYVITESLCCTTEIAMTL